MLQPATTPSRPATLAENVKLTALVLGLLVFAVLVYTFLHEAGHLLMGLLFGARVTGFSVNFINLSAHVGLDGSFTSGQHAWISAAGVSFPFLVWALFALLAPRHGPFLLEALKWAVFATPVNALLAWVVIPILTLNGQTIGDDSANFLRYTGFAPMAVSAAGLLLWLGGWALFLGRAGGPRALVANLRSAPVEFTSPAARRVLGGILACGLLCAGLALALGLRFGFERRLAAPEGYNQVAAYDLKQTALNDEIAYRFELKSPQRVSLFFALKDARGGPQLIRLSGPDGYDNVFYRVDDPQFKTSGIASVHPRDLALSPGSYLVRLTFPPGMGTVEVYTRFEN